MEAPSDADVQTFQFSSPLVRVRTFFVLSLFLLSSALDLMLPCADSKTPPYVHSKRLRVCRQKGGQVSRTRTVLTTNELVFKSGKSRSETVGRSEGSHLHHKAREHCKSVVKKSATTFSSDIRKTHAWYRQTLQSQDGGFDPSCFVVFPPVNRGRPFERRGMANAETEEMDGGVRYGWTLLPRPSPLMVGRSGAVVSAQRRTCGQGRKVGGVRQTLRQC